MYNTIVYEIFHYELNYFKCSRPILFRTKNRLIASRGGFWTFSKLVWTCLGSVCSLFLTLKGLLLFLFSIPKVDKWSQKSKFYVKICSFWRFWGDIFDHFACWKSSFPYFFKVVLKLFRTRWWIICTTPLTPLSCVNNHQ